MIESVKNIVVGHKWTEKGYAKFFFSLAFLFYFSSVSNHFSIDDHLVTASNEFVQNGISGIGDILSQPYQTAENNVGEFRPVPQLFFAFEYSLFGENPHVSHLVNTLFYAFTCMLLFTLFYRLTKGAYFSIIFIGVLLFTIHPIHTEVVASLKNRENILSMFFGLLATLQFLKWIEIKKYKYLVGTILFFVFALFSKVDSVVFVAILVGVAIYKQVEFKKTILYGGLLISLFFLRNLYINFISPNSFRENFIYETPLFGPVQLLEKIGFSFTTFYHYVKLLILPYPLKFYYGYNEIPIPTGSSLSLWLGVLTFMLFVFLFFNYRKKQPLLSFSIFWFLASISIFLQLIEAVTGIIGERHAYIASAGFCLFISFGIHSVYTKIKIEKTLKLKLAFFGLFFSLVSTFFYTQDRISAWKTHDSLLEVDMPKLQQSAYAQFEYGNQLNRNADKATDSLQFVEALNKSLLAYEMATRVYPDFTFAYYNMGMVSLRLGDNEKANSFFHKAWLLDSNFRSTNYFLGLYKISQGDSLSALSYYERELENRPENVRAIERLYDICVPKNWIDRAIKNFKKVEQKKAKNQRVYFALSNLYALKGDSSQALYYLNFSRNDSLSVDPNFQW